jgi:long-chain acyl-CoA synthetase
MVNLAQTFCETARANADKTAVYWGDDLFSYRHFEAQSAHVARQLTGTYAVASGARVALWLNNSPEFIAALFGAWQAGAVVVPINCFLKADEVAYILQDAEVDLLISEAAMGEALAKLTADRPTLRVFRREEFPAAEPPPDDWQPVPRGAADLALLIYTSGTTGHPKGAMLTHGNLLHNVASCRQVLEAVSEDRFALLLPMFHSFMLTVCVLLPLLVGASIVLIRSLHPPKNSLAEMIRHRATLLPAIPQLFRALAHAPVPPNLALRLCISGAAPLPVDTLREFNAHYPARLIEGYGLSEASPVVSLNPIRGVQKPGSIGLPIANVEISIRNEEGQPLPVGQVGEVCVRGGNVMVGYWHRAEESAQALRDGWLYTGDIGYLDEEGYTYITDRKKDMLLVNGINVYPREIEEVMYHFPGVKEAAVIGRPDARKGEHPVAFVTMSDGHHLDAPALQAYLKQHLADYKLPKQIVEMATLPRNATGKILKTELRKLPFDG